MKRLLSVCLLMLSLSIPVLAGHTAAGGYCTPCDNMVCYCDPGEDPRGGSRASRTVSNEPSQDTPTDLGSEAFLILAALLLVLRYKA